MILKLVVISVITFVILIKFSNAVDYCRIKTCQRMPHTACTYKSSQPSNRCTDLIGTGLKDEEKQKIVNIHNSLRQRVAAGKENRGNPGPQPAAKYMSKLTWDKELELIAQRWANQCTWGHDKCRDVPRFYVGQNIAVMGTTGDITDIRLDSMVYNWFNEVNRFNKNDVKKYRSGGAMIGHYTQMVWAKTNKIGCGAVKYKDKGFNKFYLVCNYGPAGNVISQPIYEPIH